MLLDGLTSWMARKGFDTVDEVRGMLAVPTGTDGAAYERAGYVNALRAANAQRLWPLVKPGATTHQSHQRPQGPE